ncbi:glycosyltransferase family 2 protein [Marinicella litoralis]|uniref:GT2 family glycosyltransferase n=1 Tax=Marinicella litoralis TaxID=644220 RepID=A0A4R6XS15_9GAMM|nr:glycosyltransferase [Marinicella litoralis]TDR20814.1 GT2 family glycosyltransferase [Marinicella litoralis]
MIQIVVPIFNAFEVTHKNLQSLIKHNYDDDILFINDGSTDQRIVNLLENLPAHWEVLHNADNIGFVKTANIGLKHSVGHSVLLNSDTVVSSHWLDRFKLAINTIERLGTATPWSNNAEICSLPKTLSQNPIPTDIDQLSSELMNHLPQYPELPTAVGFCMLVTQQAKEQVGYFDETTFGMGYGEENDYSLRVAKHGLRNVLVDNCYVAHVGNQSFKEKSSKPDQGTMQRLLDKHPEYLNLIQKFIENDPLSELRESIIGKISAF